MTRSLKMAAVGLMALCGALTFAPAASAQDGVDGLHLVGYSYRE